MAGKSGTGRKSARAKTRVMSHRMTMTTKHAAHPSALIDRLSRVAEESGVRIGKKDARIAGRVSGSLIKAAKRKTGIRSDTALIEAALLNLAIADDFGGWLVRQAGRLDESFVLGL